MDGAHGSAKQLCRLRRVDKRCKVTRIHLRRLRIEDQVAASLLHLLHVAVQVAWIGLQILVGTKLYGIDKDRYHRTVVLTCRLTNQTLMTFMQESHRGHQTYRQSFLAPACYNLSYLLYGLYYFHDYKF